MYSFGRRQLVARCFRTPSNRLRLFSTRLPLNNENSSDKNTEALDKLFQQDPEKPQEEHFNDVFKDLKGGSAGEVLGIGRNNDNDAGASPFSDDSKFDLFEKLGNLSVTEQNNNELGVEDLESKYIHEERETMLNIFNKYLGNQEYDVEGEEDSKAMTKPHVKTELINEMIQMYSHDDLKDHQPLDITKNRKKTSSEISLELERQIHEALTASIVVIEQELNLWQLYKFFESLQAQWKLVSTEDMYLRGTMRDSGNKMEKLVSDIAAQSTSNPQQPIINAFTLPILFNKLIKTIACKYQDPQLAVSLFNLLKKDLNLYTICCNQQTYNEILRINWIFNGKSNLYGIEMILLEMTNNGFLGDLVTFNLLEKIIVDYHNMKMGIDLHNQGKKVRSIWNLEDDKRVQTLERRLHEMGGRLRNESR